MPEPAPQEPLTNVELATYHDQVAGARQSYDPDMHDTFVRPQDAWAHAASDEFVYSRLRHATEADQELVTQREPGRHELSFKSLEADFSQLSKFVQEDVGALTEAIRDPAKVRNAWWDAFDSSDGRTWRPTTPRGSTQTLTLEEAKFFLEDRESTVPKDETEALRSASIRVTTALLENWKQKKYRGTKTPDDRDIPLLVDVMYSDERTSLGKHLESGQKREDVESKFRSVHRSHIAHLGRAATNAVGIRRQLSGETGQRRPESTSGTTLAEQRDELVSKHREQILHSPVEVRRVIARARSEYVDKRIVPAQQKFDRDSSDQNRDKLTRAEGKLDDIRMLYRFVARWQHHLEAGNEVGFDEYMTSLAGDREAEEGQFAGADGRVPDDVERRRAEFDGAYYGAYNSADSFAFTRWLDRTAHGRANQQFHSQQAA